MRVTLSGLLISDSGWSTSDNLSLDPTRIQRFLRARTYKFRSSLFSPRPRVPPTSICCPARLRLSLLRRLVPSRAKTATPRIFGTIINPRRHRRRRRFLARHEAPLHTRTYYTQQRPLPRGTMFAVQTRSHPRIWIQFRARVLRYTAGWNECAHTF